MIDSLLHLYRDLYYRLPQSLKRLLGGVYGAVPLQIRFGSAFRKHSQLLDVFASLSEDEQLRFLYEKTRETLLFALENLPFYRRAFEERGFSMRRFSDLSGLGTLPLLTKDDIRANLPMLVTNRFERPTEYFTGGSTTTPMKYYLPLYTSRAKERAYTNYILNRLGYTPRQPAVLLKGREIARPKSNCFWEYEPVDNFLVVSSNYLHAAYAPHILRAVAEFHPTFFWGYPSAVLDYVKMARREGCSHSSRIRGVVLSSETVLPEALDLIRDFFACNVITHYGHTERASIAYRINSQPYSFLNCYGVSRIVDNEIVSIGFDNLVMPLINYRTNDFVEGGVVLYTGTDIAITAESITGRMQEYLITNDGRLISICVMGAGHFSALAEVRALQYRQVRPGFATLLVEADDARVIAKERIKKQLEAHTHGHIHFKVEVTNRIERSNRGKRVLCVQSLDVDLFRKNGILSSDRRPSPYPSVNFWGSGK